MVIPGRLWRRRSLPILGMIASGFIFGCRVRVIVIVAIVIVISVVVVVVVVVWVVATIVWVVVAIMIVGLRDWVTILCYVLSVDLFWRHPSIS